MNNFDFCREVNDFSEKERASFHMPGHKGRLKHIPSRIDVTELDGTDNLYSPYLGGSLDCSLRAVSELYKSTDTVVLAGGSTLAIFAAIHAVARKSKSKKVISERNIHRSVVYAFAHCKLDPTFVYTDGMTVASDDDIISAITDNTDSAAVVLTSPDYYGRMRDIERITKVAQCYNIPVIIDAAHGAHLDFWNGGQLSPVRIPGTVVAQSLHKTLPALTGAALLHSNGVLSREEMLTSVELFGSTSPSYLISTSAFEAIHYMATDGSAQLDILLDRIYKTKRELKKFGFSFAEFNISDPFRMTLISEYAGFTEKLYNYLYERGIVCEFFDSMNIVMIPSVMNRDCDFALLTETMKSFKFPQNVTLTDSCFPNGRPKKITSISDAVNAEYEVVDIDHAQNRVSALPVSPYPPGIAVIVPGELITENFIPYLKQNGISTVKVIK